VVRPEGREVAARVGHAVQVLERAPGLEERVALDVVEEVAGVWLREQAEAALLLRLEQVVAVGAREPREELELGLVAEPLEGVGRHVVDCRAWCGIPERSERRDPRRVQALDLVMPDPRDLDEVVVVYPALVAEVEEVAEAAVVDRVGIGVGASRVPGSSQAPLFLRRRVPGFSQAPLFLRRRLPGFSQAPFILLRRGPGLSQAPAFSISSLACRLFQ